MNLNFGVCWIEDQPHSTEIAAIEDAIRRNGFDPYVDIVKTDSEIQKSAQKQEQFHDFHLILLDLRLGSGRRGDDLASDIRLAFRSTPIIFYSAEDEDTLRRLIADQRVEGVYCAHRQRLAERVGQLVSDLSPALNRLSGMRGLVSGIVAECDQEFRAILRHWADNVFPETDLIASLKERAQSAGAQGLETMESVEDLNDLLNQRAVSSALLFQEVFHGLKRLDPAPDPVLDKRFSLRDYLQKILGVRNVLAHGLEERTAHGWRIGQGGSRPDLTADDFGRFRSDFQSHLRDVRELRELLVGQKPQ